MADPVAVGIDVGTLLFMIVGACGVIGVMGYSKFSQYMHGRQIKNEIRQEITDRRQTDLATKNAEAISEVKRELDKIQTK